MAKKGDKARMVALPGSSHPVPAGSEAVRQTSGRRWLDLTVGVRPDPKAVKAIEEFAKAHNLVVTRDEPASARMGLAGTVEDVNAAFGVTLFDYTHPKRGDFQAHTGPVHIPADADGAITGVDFVDDPITPAQVEILTGLLGDQWSKKARDGFLVISGRFVDDMGIDRTEELATLFQTQSVAGRLALRRSLERLLDFVRSLRQYEQDYPVLINDPQYGSVPAFPQLP
ncbi:MAG: protease pro-enzyme activation domain-containing protein, partial [Mycobacterium sp.]